MAQLREARALHGRQVDVRRARNVAQRAAYEALRRRARLQEAALRRLEEEARDLLERLVQRKARAAAERNLRNERRERSEGSPGPFLPRKGDPRTPGEGAASCAWTPASVSTPRAKQALVSQELKAAAKRTVSISE